MVNIKKQFLLVWGPPLIRAIMVFTLSCQSTITHIAAKQSLSILINMYHYFCKQTFILSVCQKREITPLLIGI